MLTIKIPSKEMYDEKNNRFFNTKETILQLEHSLISLSKWESKWNKPFLINNKSKEETLDYIKCMTITKNIDDSVYSQLSNDNISKISEYISEPMTATTFSNNNKSHSKEIITSELIYYWMIALNIPMECQKWHLNRLLTLIRVCEIKNEPSKKMGKTELINRNKMLNAQRRAKLGSKG